MHSAFYLSILASIHLVVLAFISPTFWHDVLQQTPVHVIAAAGVVTVIVQTCKRLAPDMITGRWTLVVNLALSVAAVFVSMKPDMFWTQTTLTQLLEVFVMASGTHAVGRGLFKPKAAGSDNRAPMQVPYGSKQQDFAPADTQMTAIGIANLKMTEPPTADQRVRIRAGSTLPCLLAIGLLFGLTGCGIRAATPATAPPLPAGAADQTDAHANQVLRTIQGFMVPLARDIKSGKLQASPEQRHVLNVLDDYYNKASLAEQSYHHCMTVTAASVPAQPPNAVSCLTQAGLSQALASAEGAMATATASLPSSIIR